MLSGVWRRSVREPVLSIIVINDICNDRGSNVKVEHFADNPSIYTNVLTASHLEKIKRTIW